MRKIFLEYLAKMTETTVIGVATVVNLYEEAVNLSEEMLINYMALGRKMMILDIGALVSLAFVSWIIQYLKEFDLKVGEMKSLVFSQVFSLDKVNIVLV